MSSLDRAGLDCFMQSQTLRIQQVLRQPYQPVHVQMAPRPEPAHVPSRSLYAQGCNCGGCRKAEADYQRTRRMVSCGRASLTRYSKHGCRCCECRCENARYRRQYRGKAS
jgi:hypothetical protein